MMKTLDLDLQGIWINDRKFPLRFDSGPPSLRHPWLECSCNWLGCRSGSKSQLSNLYMNMKTSSPSSPLFSSSLFPTGTQGRV